MPVAAPTYWNVTMGSPRRAGGANVTLTPGSAVSGDITFVVSNAANVVTAGAFLDAARTAAEHFKSSGLLK